jgi:hypothetical protein
MIEAEKSCRPPQGDGLAIQGDGFAPKVTVFASKVTDFGPKGTVLPLNPVTSVNSIQ